MNLITVLDSCGDAAQDEPFCEQIAPDNIKIASHCYGEKTHQIVCSTLPVLIVPNRGFLIPKTHVNRHAKV